MAEEVEGAIKEAKVEDENVERATEEDGGWRECGDGVADT